MRRCSQNEVGMAIVAKKVIVVASAQVLACWAVWHMGLSFAFD